MEGGDTVKQKRAWYIDTSVEVAESTSTTDAIARIDELDVRIKDVQKRLRATTAKDFDDDGSFKEWLQRTQGEILSKRGEREYLVKWVRRFITDFIPKGNLDLEEIVRSITARAQEMAAEIRGSYTREYFPERPPADIGAAQKRWGELVDIKNSLVARFAELRGEWYSHPLNRDRFTSAKAPLQSILGELEAEMATIKKVIRAEAAKENIAIETFSATGHRSQKFSRLHIRRLIVLDRQGGLPIDALELFLANPDVVYTGADALHIARMTASSATDAQERAVIFGDIAEVTKDNADIQEVARVWETKPEDLATQKEIGYALASAYVAVGDIDAATAVARVFDATGSKVDVLLKIAEKCDRFHDEIRRLINAQPLKDRAKLWSRFIEITKNSADMAAFEKCLLSIIAQASGQQVGWQYLFYVRALIAMQQVDQARSIITDIHHPHMRLNALALLAQETRDKLDAQQMKVIISTIPETERVHHRGLLEIANGLLACQCSWELRKWAQTRVPSDACILFSRLAASKKETEEDLRKASMAAAMIPTESREQVALPYLTEALVFHGRILPAKKMVMKIADRHMRCQSALIIHQYENP